MKINIIKYLAAVFIFIVLGALLLPGTAFSATYRVYGCTSLTGGVTGSLDNINGSKLNDGDIAICVMNQDDATYPLQRIVYKLDADSGLSESSPNRIVPDAIPGTKVWLITGLGADVSVGKSSASTALDVNGIVTADSYVSSGSSERLAGTTSLKYIDFIEFAGSEYTSLTGQVAMTWDHVPEWLSDRVTWERYIASFTDNDEPQAYSALFHLKNSVADFTDPINSLSYTYVNAIAGDITGVGFGYFLNTPDDNEYLCGGAAGNCADHAGFSRNDAVNEGFAISGYFNLIDSEVNRALYSKFETNEWEYYTAADTSSYWLKFVLFDDANTALCTLQSSNGSITAGVRHVIFVYTAASGGTTNAGQDMNIYYEGNLIATGNTSTTCGAGYVSLIDGTEPFKVGRVGGGAASDFRGLIGDFQFHHIDGAGVIPNDAHWKAVYEREKAHYEQ